MTLKLNLWNFVVAGVWQQEVHGDEKEQTQFAVQNVCSGRRGRRGRHHHVILVFNCRRKFLSFRSHACTPQNHKLLQTMNYYNWLYNPFSWATIAILVMFYFMWWDMLLLVWYYCAKLPALSTNLDDVRLESSCSEFWFWTSFDIWFYVWIK